MFKVWLKHSQDAYVFFVFFYYNLSIKGEKYRLDLTKLLISWSDCFLSQSKYLDQLSYRKTKQNKNKCKKSFAGVTEKYIKIEEYLNMYDGKLFDRNQCSECSVILLKTGFVTCWKFYFWTCTKLGILFEQGKPTRHLIYYAY